MRVRSYLKSLLIGATLVATVPLLGIFTTELGKTIGTIPVPVEVLGTGSMYPSLYWSKSEGGPEDESQKVIEEYRTTPHLYSRFPGISLGGKEYLKRQVGHGDIVAFKNQKTAEILSSSEDLAATSSASTTGFIKRVIGLPGDRLELRDGFVYLSGTLLDEPYIATARSTYGGATLSECSVVTVPEGSYFVMGDNRKVSSDSRSELGLIKDEDISYVLPFAGQSIYHSLYRSTSSDASLLGQPTLIPKDFIELLNSYRQNQGLASLKSEPLLMLSTTYRGQAILSNPDTTLDMKSSIARAHYQNILLGEFVSYGHYSAKELLESLLYNPNTAKQITSGDYDDIGLSVVNQEVNGCPRQVIVAHLGGYQEAQYDSDTIQSWHDLRANLAEVLPSWQKALDYQQLDQLKLKELITLLQKRLALATEITQVIDKKAWLTEDQQARIKQDELDSQNTKLLSEQLNQGQ